MQAPPPLERGYRRVLRVLPTSYRERWEEDMVAVLLDAEQDAAARAVAAEGAARQQEERELALLGDPPLREVAGVLGLALRLHLAGPSTPGASARSRAVGDAVRLTALLGLLLPAAQGVLQLALLPWWTSRPDSAPVAPDDALAGLVATTAAVLVWVLLVAGRARGAVLAAVAGVVVPAAVQLQLVPSAPATAGVAVTRLALLLPLLALAAWHRDAARPSPRWWWALPAGTAVTAGLWGLEVAGAAGAAFAAEPLVAAAALVVGLRRTDRGWLGAALLLAGLSLVRALAVLPSTAGAPAAYGAAAVAVAVVSAAVAAVAAVRLRPAGRRGGAAV